MESFPLLFMSFFAMANPVGNLPIFIGLTQGRNTKQIRRVGLITTLAFFIICVVSMLLGEAVLKAFGISLAAFRTAGGLLIALIGLRMLLGSKETASYHHVDHNSTEDSPDAVGVV
ncbi:MAG: MarC family protein, partial [Pseudomonadota bacterium]